MKKEYSMKGRGYQTRGMQQLSDGSWVVPMYRNRDDAMLGSFEIPTNPPRTARQAFEVARKQCWNEYTLGH